MLAFGSNKVDAVLGNCKVTSAISPTDTPAGRTAKAT
jgi:hypothetical protein